MKKNISIETKLAQVAEETLDEVQLVVDSTGEQIEQTVAPIRKSILKRFPVLFLLAVTFGFTATVTGIEQLLVQYDLLDRHPTIILLLGIGTLVLTGTLYKKLG